MTELLHVSGLDELKQTLTSLPVKLQNTALRSAGRQAGQTVRDKVRYAIFGAGLVHTGFLFDSITVVVRTQRGGGTRIRIGVGDAFYGKFQEFGTVKMKATPFMRPAFQVAAPEVIRDTALYLRQGIDKIAASGLRAPHLWF